MQKLTAFLSVLSLLVLVGGVACSEPAATDAGPALTQTAQPKEFVRIEDIMAKSGSGEPVSLMAVSQKDAKKDTALKESQTHLYQLKRLQRCGRMVNYTTCN